MRLARREGLLLGHQAGRKPLEDGAGLRLLAQPETADQDGTVLGDHGA
jgi:hypothetical protein